MMEQCARWPEQIQILMVDDHAMVREGLKFVLSEAPEMAVTAEAGSVPEALALLKAYYFDIVLLDLSLPGQSGMELLRTIKAKTPTLPVLVVSAYAQDPYAAQVLKSGGDGYINKDDVSAVLIKAIRQVTGGKKYFSLNCMS